MEHDHNGRQRMSTTDDYIYIDYDPAANKHNILIDHNDHGAIHHHHDPGNINNILIHDDDRCGYIDIFVGSFDNDYDYDLHKYGPADHDHDTATSTDTAGDRNGLTVHPRSRVRIGDFGRIEYLASKE